MNGATSPSRARRARGPGLRARAAGAALAVVLAAGSAAAAAETEPASSPRGPAPLPADLEVRLALSALPAHLRDGATVHRLDPSRGFVVEREGTNGFHAFVARNEPAIAQGSWDYERYPDLLIPVAFDAAGVDSHVKAYFDLARYRATGVPPAEAKRRLVRDLAAGRYPAPARAGIAYMLAPVVRGYHRAERGPEIVTFSLPHVMFYAPGVRDEDIGGGGGLALPFVLSSEPGPLGLIIVLAGEQERRAIREESADLLAALCAFDADLCLRPPP